MNNNEINFWSMAHIITEWGYTAATQRAWTFMNSNASSSTATECMSIYKNGDVTMGANLSVAGAMTCGKLTIDKYIYLSLGSGSHPYNLALGSNSSLSSNTSGYYNTAIGQAALRNNTSGYNNIGIGQNALIGVSTGTYNTSVGDSSGESLKNSSYNTYLGFRAGINGSGYSYCTAIGYESEITKEHQIMLGTPAETVVCPGSLTVNHNISLPESTGFNQGNMFYGDNTTSYMRQMSEANVCFIDYFGTFMFRSTTDARGESAAARLTIDPSGNVTATGKISGVDASFTGTVSGVTNTMVGLGNCNNTSDLQKPISNATQSALDGKVNSLNPVLASSTMSGFTKVNDVFYCAPPKAGTVPDGQTSYCGCLLGNYSGNNNEFNFWNINNTTTNLEALAFSWIKNSIVIAKLMNNGDFTCGKLTIDKSIYLSLGSGSNQFNLALGSNASLSSNTSGNNNMAIGQSALRYNTSGTRNIGIGQNALDGVSTGTNNTSVGENSGESGNSSYNTYLGYRAGINGSGYSYCTAIGYQSEITAPNQIMLGTANETVVCPGSLTVNHNISATGTITTGSDYRIKEDIKPLQLEDYSVDNLNPVTFKFKKDDKESIGLIAHELQEFYPFLVEGEKDGETTQTVNYNGLIGVLIKEIQELKREVKELKQIKN
jgi:putative hemolysin